MKPSRIPVTREDLVSAADRGAMSRQDVDSLWQELVSQHAAVTPEEPTSGFDIGQLAYYAGGVLVMIAMGWFMERAQAIFGAGGVVALAVAYAIGFSALGYKLYFKDKLRIPGGLLYTLAVLMTPIAVSAGIESLGSLSSFGYDKAALLAEIATGAAGLLVLSRVRVALVSATVWGALWFASMTVAELVTGSSYFFFSSNHYLFTSMAIGAAIIAASFYIDSTLGRSEDYSWWGYLFGVAAFWVSLSMLDNGSEFGKLVYFLINVAMLLASVVLARRVFLIAGAVGSVYYVGHLLYTFFSDSLAFPFALIALGIGVIYLGVQYRRNQAAIDGFVIGLVPAPVRKHLPRT